MKIAAKTKQSTGHAMTLPAIIFVCLMFVSSMGCVSTKKYNFVGNCRNPGT
jgi:hypothetical protein